MWQKVELKFAQITEMKIPLILKFDDIMFQREHYLDYKVGITNFIFLKKTNRNLLK